MSILIPDKLVKDTCKIGCKGETCRYLTLGRIGFECAKHGELAAVIDNLAENGQMTAQGDNCAGLFPDD